MAGYGRCARICPAVVGDTFHPMQCTNIMHADIVCGDLGTHKGNCSCRDDPRQTDLKEGIERSDNGFCTWKNNKCQYIPQTIWPIVVISLIVVIIALFIVGLIVRAIIRGMTNTKSPTRTRTRS